MKKYYYLLLTVATLTLSIIIGSFFTLNHALKNIEINIAESHGTIDQADAIKITHYIKDNRLIWASSHNLMDVDNVSTKAYVDQESNHQFTKDYKMVPLVPLISNITFQGIDHISSFEEKRRFFYPKLAKVVAEQTANGEVKTMRLNLKDYYEYYHLRIEGGLHLNDIDFGIIELIELIVNSRVKIPVQSDILMDVKVEKLTNGSIAKISYKLVDKTQVKMLKIICIEDQNGYYLYPYGASNIQRTLDQNHFIYFVPREELKKGFSILNADDNHYKDYVKKLIEIKYKNATHLAMSLSANGKYIYLLSSGDQKAFLSVIDIQHMVTIQTLDVPIERINRFHCDNQMIFTNEKTVVIKTDSHHCQLYSIDGDHQLSAIHQQPIALQRDLEIKQVISSNQYVSIVQTTHTKQKIEDTIVTLVDQNGASKSIVYQYNFTNYETFRVWEREPFIVEVELSE